MSKIEVDAITEQSGTTLTTGGGAGKTVVVDATTVTIGRCGGTVALASGASQTGFGREGSVDWQTGSIKTATFTAVSGEGYFINQGSQITANLPAGSAGAIVAFSDYARNFATYNLLVSPNGSEKIGGVAQDAELNVNGQSATFVYVDATKGWVNVQNAEDTETGVPPFVAATGGTITEDGNFKVHTFTGPGTFEVTRLSPTPANNFVDYMIIAGGGGGGYDPAAPTPDGGRGGGGGAGGYRESPGALTSYTASPLGASPAAALPVSVTSFPVTVGAGATSQVPTTRGSDSVFSSITTTGGGNGGVGQPSPTDRRPGSPGGSGGGSGTYAGAGVIGSGNTPPVSPPQGNNGGLGVEGSPAYGAGGGGGAGGVGGGGSTSAAGSGGNGTASGITGSPVTRAGGGGGATQAAAPTAGTGGPGGGGAGAALACAPSSGVAGTANTGSGGGGSGGLNFGGPGGNGGSGIVVIRYQFQ